MFATDTPFGQFFDLDGRPLNGGSIYFGQAGSNPRTSPIQVFFDGAGTVPADQPVPVVNGFPARIGTPALVYTAQTYSMLVLDRQGRQVYYLSDSSTLPSALASGLSNYSSGSLGAALVGARSGVDYPLNSVGHWLFGAPTLESYGAVGDGVTDDTLAIQAALDIGGTWNAHRTYRVTDTLEITQDDTRLNGVGAKFIHDTSSKVTVIYAVGRANFHVSGIEVDGRKSLKSGGGAVAAYGIDVADCDGYSVSGCYVHDCHEHGIRYGSKDDTPTPKTTNGRISNNYCKDNGNTANERGWGIWGIKKIDGVVIDGNVCMNNIAGGIMVDDTHNPVDGLGCDNIVISNNVVKSDRVAYGGNSRCIQVSGTNNFVITGNRCTGYRMGIAVTCGQAGTRTGSGNVSNNVVTSNEYGILIDTVRRATVDNNQIFMTAAASIAGIDVINQAIGESPLIDFQISNNFMLCSVVGIQCGRRTGHDTVMNNVTIANNVLRHSGATANTHRGIDLNDCQGATVYGNQVSSFYDGIFTDVSCTNITIEGNKAVSLANYGYRLGGVTLFFGNTGRSNTAADLRIEAAANSASTVLMDNKLRSGTATSGTLSSTTRQNNLPAI